MRNGTRWLMLIVLIVGFAFAWSTPAQAQTVSGFEHTSFNLSFDLSSVQQIGDDSPDLTFQDVTFGAGIPLSDRVGLWLTVSKAADFNRAETETRKLKGGYGVGLSYTLARRTHLTTALQGGVISRLEHVGDGDLNPTALRLGVKVGYRVLGDRTSGRWFGFFIQGGSDIAMRDIMSMSDGNIMKGDTTYHARIGFEFSL